MESGKEPRSLRIVKVRDDFVVTIPPAIRTFLKISVGDWVSFSLGFKEVIVKKASFVD